MPTHSLDVFAKYIDNLQGPRDSVLQGTLGKLGKKLKIWTARRCFLTPKVMHYTHAAYAGQYKGIARTIPLEDIVEVAPGKCEDGKHVFQLVLWTGEQVVFMSTSAGQVDRWCSQIEELRRTVLDEVTSLPKLRGVLSKMGKKLKVWMPRLCVVSPTELAYTSAWKKKGPMTRIKLADVRRVYTDPTLATKGAQCGFSVVLWSAELHHFRAKTPKDADQWVECMAEMLPRARVQARPTHKNSNLCYLCGEEFKRTVLRMGKTGRHHCRNCGQSVCEKCSNYVNRIPRLNYSTEQLVCMQCFGTLSLCSVLWRDC